MALTADAGRQEWHRAKVLKLYFLMHPTKRPHCLYYSISRELLLVVGCWLLVSANRQLHTANQRENVSHETFLGLWFMVYGLGFGVSLATGYWVLSPEP